MSKKHGSKPRREKKYRARPVNPQAAYVVIRDNWRANFSSVSEAAKSAGLREKFCEPVGAEQQDSLSREYRTAFVSLLYGGGGADEWNTVVEALNIALVLCQRGFGREYEGSIVAALEAAALAMSAYKNTGKWGWPESSCVAINEGLDIHVAQLEQTKQADVLSAIAEVARRIDANDVYKEAA